MKKTINLREIRIDGGTQSRVEINMETVQEYAAEIEGGESLPPMTVFFDGVDHWLADGFHRFHAYCRLNREKVTVECNQGDKRAAILYSVSANTTHGLRRTNEDKRKAVLTLLKDEEWSKWTDSAIAKSCCVDHKTVTKIRSGMSDPSLGKSQVSDERTYITKHGTQATMNTAKIGKTKPIEPPPTTATAPDRSAEQPGPVTSTQPETPKPVPKDGEAALQQTQPQQQLQEQPQTPASDAGDPETQAQDEPDVLALLEELQADNERLTAEMKAMAAEDKNAEILKWRRVAEAAERAQGEAMERAAKKDKELQWQGRIISRICKISGEEDPTKLASTVEAFYRKHGAAPTKGGKSAKMVEGASV